MLRKPRTSVVVAIGALLIAVLPISTASAVVNGFIGSPASNTSYVYNFAGSSPALTATFAGTPSANMKNKGDFSGIPMDSWTSTAGAANSSGAFTPSSVLGTYGVGMGWNSGDSFCSGMPSTVVAGTTYSCTPQTVTFTFSAPVTNPVINVANLAGGGTYGSFWSGYTLRDAGSLVLLSSAGNFHLTPDARGFGVINPPGTGFTPSDFTHYQAYDLLPSTTKPGLYGAGNGAVQVMGTFTTLTFDVNLSYRNFTVAEDGAGNTNKQNYPEWVEFVPVAGLGLAPVVANPQNQVTNVDTQYTGTAAISGNSAGTIYSVTVNPSHGSVTMNADGSFTYVPNNGYTGTDVFTYKLCDPNDATNCATSTVTLNIGLALTGFNQMPYWMFSFALISLGSVMVLGTRIPKRRSSFTS